MIAQSFQDFRAIILETVSETLTPREGCFKIRVLIRLYIIRLFLKFVTFFWIDNIKIRVQVER